MLLDNYPEETPRLKRHNRFFEWVTYLILIASYATTFLPLELPINRFGINLVFLVVGMTTILSYRVFPFEKRTGWLRYTYKLKGFQINISDHIFASAVIFFSGGIASPFWFVYLLALIAGAMYLPAWSLIVLGIEAVILYLFTVAFLTPYVFGEYEVGLSAQMVIVPMASFFSVIMTYVVAKDFSIEIKNIRTLANNLKQKTVEVTGEKNKLDTIVTAVSDGIFVLDKKRRLVFINKAAETILQVKRSEVHGKSFDELFSVTDFENNKITQAQLCPGKKLEEDQVVFGPKDLKFKIKSGEEPSVRLSSTEIKEGDELDIGCICVFIDVNKEKELEDMKLDFVAMAAHELRTPLTAIRGYLSILIEEVTKKLSPEEGSWLQKAFISSSHLAALVENLLSVSRIELKSLKLETKNIAWEKLLQEIVSTFKTQADQKNIKLSLEIKEKLPEVLVDKFRISEVLSNLLANALTYTKPGGKIEVTSWQENDSVVTSIKDTGEGIPESAIPRLFTKFFRVSGVLEQGSKGTGLGLYISKSIIDMHEGKIWVKSKLGVGSTFTFSLPLSKHYSGSDPTKKFKGIT